MGRVGVDGREQGQFGKWELEGARGNYMLSVPDRTGSVVQYFRFLFFNIYGRSQISNHKGRVILVIN